MYLATFNNQGRYLYQIRQSVKSTCEGFDSHLVFDLGDNPGDHFEVFNDHIILFSSELTDAVEQGLGHDAEQELERILYRFFPIEARQRLDLFSGRGAVRVTPLTVQDRAAIEKQIHLFDRRRLYYLRYGGVDQSRLYRMHEKCCRPLLGQSRDEREFYFAEEERILKPREYFQYVYAIFNLHTYFSESFAPWFPEGLGRDAVADSFIEELCRLNQDPHFWKTAASEGSLNPHLVRYLIMFFDFQPVARSFLDDYFRRFMSGHRKFRWPEQKSATTPEQMSSVFGTSYESLRKMKKSELTRLYRHKAMKLHPDQGGDHEQFIALTTAYQDLVRSKK